MYYIAVKRFYEYIKYQVWIRNAKKQKDIRLQDPYLSCIIRFSNVIRTERLFWIKTFKAKSKGLVLSRMFHWIHEPDSHTHAYTSAQCRYILSTLRNN